MKSIAIIPARLASSRFPGKVLADLNGRPLLWHVWRRVLQAKRINQVFVAADSEEVQKAVESWGGKVLMTSPDCQSGTERIASILDQIDADFILNVQGDEPLIASELLDALVARWQEAPCDLITAVHRVRDIEDLRNPNIVKVVRAADGRALYFSRSAVPFVRDLPFEQWLEKQSFWRHIGVYGYRRSLLETYDQLPESPLEKTERLEQLRFLEAGYSIQTVETDYQPVAVDTPQDLEKVRNLMRKAD